MTDIREIPLDQPLDPVNAPAASPSAPVPPFPPGAGVTLEEVPEGVRIEPLEQPLPLIEDAARSLDDTVRMMAAGASFRWSDEFAALMNTATGLGQGATFAENLAIERARDEAIREREPGAAFVAELIGGLGTGLPGATRVMQMKMLQGFPTLLKAAGLGAAGGAVGGAGAAESGDRMAGALIGGTIGAGLGIAIPLAKNAVVSVFKRFIASKPGAEVQKAAAKILEALQRDDMTPESAFARLADMSDDTRLVDIGGENIKGLGRAVAGAPGPGKQIARTTLEARQAGQGQRLVRAVNRFLDPDGDFAATVDELNTLRRTTAKPLYDRAYGKAITPSDDLVALFERPALKQAFARAQKIAANEGTAIPDLFIKKGGKDVLNPDAMSNVKLLDFIKRGLDDIVERNTDDITGQIKGEVARGVNALRKDYVKLLDDLSPEYKAAREAWGGPSRALEMMNRGRRFVKADEDVTVKQLAKMTEDERFYFRMGAARQMRDLIFKTPDGRDAVKNIFGNELKRQRVKAVFPDDASFDEFSRMMKQEMEFFETRAVVGPRSGSPTQPRQAEFADLTGAVSELARGNSRGAVVSAVRTLLGKKLTDQQSEILARALFNNDPATNRKILDALVLARTLQPVGDIAGGALSVAAGGRAGAAVGEP